MEMRQAESGPVRQEVTAVAGWRRIDARLRASQRGDTGEILGTDDCSLSGRLVRVSMEVRLFYGLLIRRALRRGDLLSDPPSAHMGRSYLNTGGTWSAISGREALRG